MKSANNDMRTAGSGVDLPKQKIRVRGLGRGSFSFEKLATISTSQPLWQLQQCARYTFEEANGSSAE